MSPVEKFIAIFMTTKPSEGNCRFWTRTINSHGYPKFSVGETIYSAHRVSLELKLGRPLREGMFACHTCDNKACVEPDHLYEGTRQQNVDDAVARNRYRPALGSRNGAAKLTEDDVRSIKTRYKRGQVRQVDLAAEFGVTQRVISCVVNGVTWSHVEVEG